MKRNLLTSRSKKQFPEVARRICGEQGIKNIIITLGGEGMSINDASSSSHIPARPVDVFDVTGTGIPQRL